VFDLPEEFIVSPALFFFFLTARVCACGFPSLVSLNHLARLVLMPFLSGDRALIDLAYEGGCAFLFFPCSSVFEYMSKLPQVSHPPFHGCRLKPAFPPPGRAASGAQLRSFFSLPPLLGLRSPLLISGGSALECALCFHWLARWTRQARDL